MTNLFYLDPNPSADKSVLLLHGLGANGASWALNLPPLIAAGFRPLAPDLPGFGLSPYDGQGWSFKRSASQVADLMNELNLKKVDLVGLSMGSILAQQFAMDYPHLTNKLVLVSSFAALRPSNLSQWGYFIQRALAVHLIGLPAQAKLVAKRVFPAAEQADLRKMAEAQIGSANPQAYRAAMRALGTWDSRLRLNLIKAPTLIVSGENDTTIPLLRQSQLASLIKDARQVIVKNANHAVPIDQPDAFNQLLGEFLIN